MYVYGALLLTCADLSKNNITNITENNFRGQDNLHELDLSKNKILRMASSTFRHLMVSTYIHIYAYAEIYFQVNFLLVKNTCFYVYICQIIYV